MKFQSDFRELLDGYKSYNGLFVKRLAVTKVTTDFLYIYPKDGTEHERRKRKNKVLQTGKLSYYKTFMEVHEKWN